MLKDTQIPLGWTLVSDRHFNALAIGFAEIMAVVQGKSDQSIESIIEYVLEEAVNSHPPVQGMGIVERVWKPMATAPRDGTWFIARTASGYERRVHFADVADRLPIDHSHEVWSTLPVEWRIEQ